MQVGWTKNLQHIANLAESQQPRQLHFAMRSEWKATL